MLLLFTFLVEQATGIAISSVTFCNFITFNVFFFLYDDNNNNINGNFLFLRRDAEVLKSVTRVNQLRELGLCFFIN